MKKLNKVQKGFTLIELLAVIAIIGILAAIASQAIPAAFRTVRMMGATNGCRDITSAYTNYISQGAGGKSLTFTTIEGNTGAAFQLAQKAGLTSAKPWFVASEEANNAATLPDNVIDAAGTGSTIKNNSTDGYAAWAVVSKAQRSPKNPGKYPLVILRGLGATDGIWAAESPFGLNRGIVGYMDGSVSQYTVLDATGDDNFVKAEDGVSKTITIADAIGGTSTIVGLDNPSSGS